MTDLRPAVFLDRDGTLMRDMCHAADPAALALLPGAAEAMRAFHVAGYRIVIVTNQSGRGARAVHPRRGGGHRQAASIACPTTPARDWPGTTSARHHPDGSVPELARPCDCRKPAPGMLLRAAAELGLDLGESWMVGDMLSDVAAGQAAGTRVVFVDSGAVALEASDVPPPLVARNIAHAAMLVLAADGHLTEPVEPCRQRRACSRLRCPAPEAKRPARPARIPTKHGWPRRQQDAVELVRRTAAAAG